MLDWASKLTSQEQRDHDAALPSDISAPPIAEVPLPKTGVALALGGGAARGWAHIGVIEALEEEKIPIDYIVGSSAGCYVGALYACGSLQSLKEFVLKMDGKKVFSYL